VILMFSCFVFWCWFCRVLGFLIKETHAILMQSCNALRIRCLLFRLFVLATMQCPVSISSSYLGTEFVCCIKYSLLDISNFQVELKDSVLFVLSVITLNFL
jgi:hypothetical protein